MSERTTAEAKHPAYYVHDTVTLCSELVGNLQKSPRRVHSLREHPKHQPVYCRRLCVRSHNSGLTYATSSSDHGSCHERVGRLR